MSVVLVVEDRPEIQALLRAVIERAGHTPISARSAAEALVQLAHKPDLMFIDLGLPDRSGLDLAHDLRRRTDTHDKPIVFVTANPDGTQKVQASGLWNVETVLKPFRFEVVTGIIVKYLG